MLEVVGSTGAVVPEQKGATALNDGENIGFDKITPVKRLVVHPLINKVILEYNPAFKLVIITWPEPFAVKLIGPTGVPSSV